MLQSGQDAGECIEPNGKQVEDVYKNISKGSQVSFFPVYLLNIFTYYATINSSGAKVVFFSFNSFTRVSFFYLFYEILSTTMKYNGGIFKYKCKMLRKPEKIYFLENP